MFMWVISKCAHHVRAPPAGYPALSRMAGGFLFEDRKSSLSIAVERPADEVIQ